MANSNVFTDAKGPSFIRARHVKELFQKGAFRVTGNKAVCITKHDRSFFLRIAHRHLKRLTMSPNHKMKLKIKLYNTQVQSEGTCLFILLCCLFLFLLFLLHLCHISLLRHLRLRLHGIDLPLLFLARRGLNTV